MNSFAFFKINSFYFRLKKAIVYFEVNRREFTLTSCMLSMIELYTFQLLLSVLFLHDRAIGSFENLTPIVLDFSL